MTTRAKLLTTGLLVLAISGLAGIDAWRNGRELTAYVPEGQQTEGGEDAAHLLPPGAVTKQSGPDIAALIAAQGFTLEEATELSLIEQIAGDKAPAHTLAILKDADRAGSVTWVESPQVKTYFFALKESLLPAFSAQVQDLQDTTTATIGTPVRNVLTFFDPGLSPERLAFVRVRERLYEFHIASGKEEMMGGLIEVVTSQ